MKKMAPIQPAALLTFIVVGSGSAGAQSPPPGQLAPGSSGRAHSAAGAGSVASASHFHS